jgi:hypothetical protein
LNGFTLSLSSQVAPSQVRAGVISASEIQRQFLNEKPGRLCKRHQRDQQGLESATAGGTINLNNYTTDAVTIAAPTSTM